MAEALNQSDEQDQIVDLDDSPTGEEDQAAPEGEATAEPELEEVVIEDSDSQTEKVATQASIDKLVRRLGKAKGQTKDVEQELQVERQRREMLELALEQERQAKKGPPDPAEFDEGSHDPKFAEAQAAYIAELAAQKVSSQLPVSEPKDDLREKQVKHAERANELKISDYAEVQDAAIETVGHELANEIIKASKKSHIVLYHFGKNPAVAERWRAIAESDPLAATLEIGRLEERLKVRPKAKTQPLPDPDGELRGADGGARTALRGPKGATFV